MRQSSLFLHLFKMVFKILGKILQHIRMFQTKMFTNGGRRILVLVSALKQMPSFKLRPSHRAPKFVRLPKQAVLLWKTGN